MLQFAYIESLDSEGRGVARLNNKVIFIDNALPNEEVLYQTLQQKNNYDIGLAKQLLKISPLRQQPVCEYFNTCGGCSLQHLDYSAQVAFKQRILEENLWRIGNSKAEQILPIIQGPNFLYRYRAKMLVKYLAKQDQLIFGFNQKKSNTIVNIAKCYTIPQYISDLINPLKESLNKLTIKDNISQIDWAVGDELTVLSLQISQDPTKTDQQILQKFIDENTQTKLQLRLHNKLNPQYQYLYPQDIKEKLSYSLAEFNLTLPFTPAEFTQVNPYINEMMISRAMKLLNPKPGEKILDLFCGLGNFTLPIASLGAQVIGIEGSKKLVKRAIENAQFNHLSQLTEFKVANLFDEKQINFKAWGKVDKWLIDPPRDGAFELVKLLPKNYMPQLIVYISCKPTTLARDAKVLLAKGYQLKSAGIMNMFPNTAHVESIAVFEYKPQITH